MGPAHAWSGRRAIARISGPHPWLPCRFVLDTATDRRDALSVGQVVRFAAFLAAINRIRSGQVSLFSSRRTPRRRSRRFSRRRPRGEYRPTPQHDPVRSKTPPARLGPHRTYRMSVTDTAMRNRRPTRTSTAATGRSAPTVHRKPAAVTDRHPRPASCRADIRPRETPLGRSHSSACSSTLLS